MPEATSFPQFSPVRMRATTEDAAIQQALLIVGLQLDQVSVEVLEQDAKGVTIRVRPRTENDAPSAAPAPVQPTAAQPQPAQPERTQAAPVAAVETAVEPAATPSAADEAEETQADENADGDIADNEAVDDATEVVPLQSAPPLSAPRATRIIDEATQERALAAIEDILERMGMEAIPELAEGPFSPVEAGDDDAASRLYIKIEGDDVGILIGKHGQTLQALQYLLNLTLNNHSHDENGVDGAREDAVRVVLDAGGYRSRRAQVLQQSAQEAASRAKRDRRSIRLEPMPAHERRLVHMALREDTTISTGSEGREPLRHVVISPAGMRPSGGERPERLGGGGGGGGRGGNRGGGFGGNRGGFGGGNRGGGFGNRGSR
ncbi:MAG: spoIIIJ-associated protein [Abditibacteriota bacterium]|nr:spoIIIJ-associated protein [Abditibacteriota bacterium]